jgi:hypothetical protein
MSDSDDGSDDGTPVGLLGQPLKESRKGSNHASTISSIVNESSLLKQHRKGSTRFSSSENVDKRLLKFASVLFARSAHSHFLTRALSSQGGQESFMTFLQTRRKHDLDFLLAVENLKEAMSSDEFLELAKEVVNTFIKQKPDIHVAVSASRRTRVMQTLEQVLFSGPAEVVMVLEEAAEDVLDALAAGAFDEWMAENPDMELPKDDPSRPNPALTPGTSDMARLAAPLAAIRDTWLYHLLQYVDRLPKICVSLAAGSRDTSGFPLLHVNKTFEETYEYTRADWFGRNCRFLQEGKKLGHHAEKDAIQKMSDALRRYRPVRVTITNFTKEGKAFRNHVALVPIFDADGYCVYVLCFAFAVLGDGAMGKKKERIVDEIIGTIPAVWP